MWLDDLADRVAIARGYFTRLQIDMCLGCSADSHVTVQAGKEQKIEITADFLHHVDPGPPNHTPWQ